METYLPEEIIEIILCHEDLSINDVVNFSLTNKYYYDVISNNNTVWKKTYFQIWPQFAKLFEKHDSDFCWYDEVRYVYVLKGSILETLHIMHLRLCKYYQLFAWNFIVWWKIYEETPRTYYYAVDVLKNLVNTEAAINTIKVVPTSTPGNKTLQYYATKVLRYLQYLHLMDESHVKQPLELQTLETKIVLVTQWCRPNFDVSWKDVIPNKFDEWAKQVMVYLKVFHPNHPLFAVSEEDLKMWREEDIDGNKYDTENCKKVVQALESVMVFMINSEVSMDILQDDVLLEEFLATDLIAVYGIYTGLLLTYQCVARRLGLKYDIILSDDRKRYVLRLSSNDSNAELPIARRQQFDQIKAICQYRFSCDACVKRLSQCPGLQFLELLEALSPLNISSKRFIKEYYVDQTDYFPLLVRRLISKEIRNSRSVIREMMNIIKEEQRGCEEIVKDSQIARPENLKYAVGMVMKHVTTRRKCVICDWDPACFASVGWQRHNKVHSLKFKNYQPFYNTLNQFGSYQYIAQECLEPSTRIARLLTVKDIGRHFSHVFETHFVPNEAKESKYPADAAVRHMFHQKLKSDNLKS